ncbi:LysM peptidoglycan-binding domain-containing protein [Aspergillus fijiensis CBS 313.89]|uniref:LysM domain-containing protein n=1 Tax=Aspergillus fijiensis CBS 313.89 TaxID=1448319 RepID=A0A8G1W431_9EURO|nr:uncharacterized protein BO72DRAFT_140679 [Aspergillus fijiensis CBS 313.89]RAK82201.1 hypothetical protein BO72DRAFT_140679 [Aspergillus fijiensis CBS 313.89]
MGGADILLTWMLLCSATVAQVARGPDVAAQYFAQQQRTLGTSQGDDTSSSSNFRGFQLWSENNKLHARTLSKLSPSCRASMTQKIHCHAKTRSLQRQWARWQQGPGLGNDTLSDLVCDSGCGESLATWFLDVERDCATLEERMLFPTLRGGQLWAGWNETCLRDEGTGRYCGDVINGLSKSLIDEMPTEELCSFCNVQWHRVMQTSPFSFYDKNYKSRLEHINRACDLNLPTAIPKLVLSEDPHIDRDPYCATLLSYTTSPGDTCDSIAAQFQVASAAVRAVSWPLIDCFAIPEGMRLCTPFRCKTHTLRDGDTCDSIERELDLKPWLGVSAIRAYNHWVNQDCSNLHEASDALFGHVICVGPTGQSILDE